MVVCIRELIMKEKAKGGSIIMGVTLTCT